jgi:restriction system protein
MPFPKYNDIMFPLLQYLSDRKPHTILKINDHLVNHFQLTTEEKNQTTPKGNKTLFGSRCEWARFYLKKAELIEIPKIKHICISKSGLDFLKSHTSSFDKHTLLEIQCFAKFIDDVEYKSMAKKREAVQAK